MNIFGYFDSPDQTTPAFDPGRDVSCPFCHKKLSAPMVSISFMPMARGKCYFYRAHKECAASASPEDECRIESWIIDKETRK